MIGFATFYVLTFVLEMTEEINIRPQIKFPARVTGVSKILEGTIQTGIIFTRVVYLFIPAFW